MQNRKLSGRPRALVGMAHPQRRRRVVAALREDGWSVTSAEDGFHLVRLMSAAVLSDQGAPRPDLIICDATMAGCTGLTVLRGIRDLQWLTPVILITDFNRPDAMAEAIALGATRVFEKPVDVNAVRAAAHELRSPRRGLPSASPALTAAPAT